jgi:dTDP-glucose 4,6-dehydratase
MNKTYCILGGGGSFGIHTAFYLLEHANPKKVIGVGRNPLRSEPFSLGIDKQKNYEYHTRHIYYEQDLLLELLEKERPEVIINYAAQGEGAVSWEHSWRFFETNAVALTKLTEQLAGKPWLEHFIQIGTSELYGSVTEPVKEDYPVSPTSPYAASKLAFDFYLLSAYRYLHFPMTILRPSNCYCPAQLLHRIIPKAIWCGLTDRKVPLHGGGKAEKSYLHVEDLARAIHLVSETAGQGRVYNVGPSNPTSIKKVVELCADALNMPFDDLCEMAEDRLGQDSCYWLDSSAIREDFGWYPEVGWVEGLSGMVEWGNKYLDQIKDLDPTYVLRG